MGKEDIQLFQPGEKFHGYVVEKLLGQGGVGTVWLVRHEVLDTCYALKVLYPEMADETSVKRFLREARLATRVRHPNLVAVHDCGYDEEKNVYYLVMDYVAGGSLRQMLAFEKRLDVNRAADIVAQVASAMRAAQAFEVVHRDIKPENIMIQPDGLVKLVDLGIAKAQGLGDSLKTNTANVFGTPAYISPEQAQCSADVDTRADIYSLGIVFYEMLTGKCPYAARSFAQILEQILSDDPPPDVRDAVKGIDPRVAVLIRRMTMKDRDRRIASFDEVLDELAKIGLGKRTGAMPVAEVAEKPEVGMKTLLDGIGTVSSAKPYDPMQDPAESIGSFASAWQSKKKSRKIFLVALGVAVVAVLVLLILAFR